MAVVKFCDWLKIRVGANEATTKVKIGDREFEVSQEGIRQLLERFESDELPRTPSVVIRAPQPAPAPTAPFVAAPPLLNVETTVDPFTAPGSMPEPVQASPGDEQPVQLEIPQDLNKRLGVPSRQTWERVIKEATRFEEGTLPALSAGSKGRIAATKALSQRNQKNNDDLQRKAGGDVNFESLDEGDSRRPNRRNS